MEKTICKACSATVDKSLEFCSSCGEWLGISINEYTEEKKVSSNIDRRKEFLN